MTSSLVMPTFTCATCGDDFSLSESVLAKYPGWTPRACRRCRDQGAAPGPARRSRPGRTAASAREEDLPLEEVLRRYSAGPVDGVFTDGAADPNPGPGGWGAVYVVDDAVVATDRGHEEHTTNNRMELTALLAGVRLVPEGVPTTVYSDSSYCVKTVNEWAAGWARNGWKRKTGPVQNLELVQELYRATQARPEITVQWIKAHDGSRWNEYADALATAYRRERL